MRDTNSADPESIGILQIVLKYSQPFSLQFRSMNKSPGEQEQYKPDDENNQKCFHFPSWMLIYKIIRPRYFPDQEEPAVFDIIGAEGQHNEAVISIISNI